VGEDGGEGYYGAAVGRFGGFEEVGEEGGEKVVVGG
jgi:hypothetical protein